MLLSKWFCIVQEHSQAFKFPFYSELASLVNISLYSRCIPKSIITLKILSESKSTRATVKRRVSYDTDKCYGAYQIRVESRKGRKFDIQRGDESHLQEQHESWRVL